VTFTAQANTAATARTATVTFTTTSGSPLVTRTVTVTQPGAVKDDCGSSTSSYCLWTQLGFPVTGRIEVGGDKDWFRFTAPATGTYTFTSSRPATNGLTDPVGAVYSSNGTLLASDDDSAGSLQFRVRVSLTVGQVYFVEVKGYGSDTGDYTVAAARVA